MRQAGGRKGLLTQLILLNEVNRWVREFHFPTKLALPVGYHLQSIGFISGN